MEKELSRTKFCTDFENHKGYYLFHNRSVDLISIVDIEKGGFGYELTRKGMSELIYLLQQKLLEASRFDEDYPIDTKALLKKTQWKECGEEGEWLTKKQLKEK